MANNRKTKERREARQAKQDGKIVKMLADIRKITDTGELPRHYVGGGQPFTRGK